MIKIDELIEHLASWHHDDDVEGFLAWLNDPEA